MYLNWNALILKFNKETCKVIFLNTNSLANIWVLIYSVDVVDSAVDRQTFDRTYILEGIGDPL